MKDATTEQDLITSLIRIFSARMPEGEYAVPFIEMAYDYLSKMIVMFTHDHVQWGRIENVLIKKHENVQNKLKMSLPFSEIKALFEALFQRRNDADDFKEYSRNLLSLSQSILSRLQDAAEAPAPIIEELRQASPIQPLMA